MQENMFTKWLQSRHITTKTLEDFNIHTDVHNLIGECIFIPIHNERGEFIFNKYRRNPTVDAKPKYLYDKGGKVTLYGYHKAQNAKSILITEGELDTLVAWSANIPAVSSTGGAMSFQEEWAELLKDKDITICFDNDETGSRGMVKVLKYLPHAYVVFLPDKPGIKDLSDYVKAGGDIHELLKTRVHFNSVEEVKEHRGERLSLWQSTFFHDAYIDEHTKPVYVSKRTKSLTDDSIVDARNCPIDRIIEFTNNKAQCIWHNDKTPSLHYYRDTNTIFCFGCSRHGDAIDVYRQVHNCSFNEAVKALKNL